MKRALTGLKQYYPVFLYAGDVIAYVLSAILGIGIAYGHLHTLIYARVLVFCMFIILINYSLYGLYKDKRSLFDLNEFLNITKALTMTGIIMFAVILTFTPKSFLIYIIMFSTLVFMCALTTCSRIFFSLIIRSARKKGYDQKRVLYFGDDNELLKKIQNNKSLGYKVVKTTTSLEELKLNLKKINTVFLKRDNMSDELLKIIIRQKKIEWKIIPSAFNLVMDTIDFDEFKDYPLILIRPAEQSLYNTHIKRMLDIIASLFAIILLSPLFIIVSALIKLESKGPIFFKHKRLGKDLKQFTFYKFRTMYANYSDKDRKYLDNEVKGLFKIDKDPRITKIGKILRRTCIDELAQLINILKGDMSIVGPRPHLKSELHFYKGWRKARFSIKPGLTGLWQINGRHEINFDKAVLYDIYYTKHVSFQLDMNIILKTIPAIIMNKGKY